jgi:hypothetical protein
VRTPNPLLALCVTLLVAAPPQLSAQDGSCDVPLVVSHFVAAKETVELVTDLTPKDLTVRVGGSPGTVKNASVDSGSKRIALILDASKKVPEDEWKLETEMAVSLIENARALDRFSLFLVGVDGVAGPFLPLGDMQAKLRDMTSSRPVTADGGERIYDALLAAAKRLDPPEFGDTIFVFGHPDDSGSNATAEQVEEIILRNLLRFYAVSFTDPLRGKLPPGFDLNKPLPRNAIPSGADNISHATGYFFSYHSVEALRFPGQLTLLEGFLSDLYAGIAKPYRLSISPNPSDKAALDLAVVKAETRNIRRDDVHYPHFIYPCTSR